MDKDMAESDKAKNNISQKRSAYTPVGAHKGAGSGKQYRNRAEETRMGPAPGNKVYTGSPQTMRAQPIKKNRKKRMLPRIMGIVVFSLLLVIFISINLSHGKADVLKGMWSYDAVTVYKFDGKGNGELILPSSQYAFTYTLQDDMLHIDFEDDQVRDTVYTFSVEEENLTLTDSDGETQFHFKRQ